MAKAKNKIKISMIGTNASDVTGSMTHLQMQDYQLLLEAGIYQGGSLKDEHNINSAKFPFKPKDIDYLFLGHVHADHSLLTPRLIKEGFEGRIIAPKGTSKLFKIMALDSAKIMDRDIFSLNKKYDMSADPIYNADDVYNTLNYFDEYEIGEVIKLNDSISFRFVNSGHIILSAQIELILTENNHTRKILYTSDLGNSIPKNYITPFEPVEKCNVCIGETTYAKASRNFSLKDRDTDLKKIKDVILNTCNEKKGKVLIPVFSLDRAQNLLTYIYDIFKDDESFKTLVLLDSPLSQRITECYLELLEGEQLDKLKEVLAWDNIRIVSDYKDSEAWQNGKQPCVILAASGFLKNGRSKTWAAKILPDSRSHILFVGFSNENSLATKVKNGNKQKTITIDKKSIPNRCGISDLKSFSSHMQRSELLKYYSDMNCEKVVLVHGNFKDKVEFSHDLQDEISRKNHTSKVVVANRSTAILV